MTDTYKIKKMISKSGLKMKYIASVLGISSYGLSLKINNKNEFKASEVSALCDLLGISSLELKEEVFFKEKVD